MATRSKLYSADDHVVETPDIWRERLSKQQWGDRVPQIVRLADGRERWAVDGQVQFSRSLAATGALSPKRFVEPQAWHEVPQAAYDPSERLKAMDQDGVDAQVLYPTAPGVSGAVFAALRDPQFQLACVQAYNDWLIDVWAKASPRLVPLCLVPLSSVDAAVKEMERAVKRGHRGVTMPAAPWHINGDLPHGHDRRWDRFWAAAVDLGIPISWHAGGDPGQRADGFRGDVPPIAISFDELVNPIGLSTLMPNFLFSAIPERHPKLQIVYAYSGLSWLTFTLEVADHEWERIVRKGAEPYPMDTSPSNVFRRQCHVTTWSEPSGWRTLGFLGADRVLWQSEFPRPISTWPNSRDTIEKNFSDTPAGDRQKVLSGNTARLYKLAV